MKHYAVVLFDANCVDEFVKLGKIAFAQIRNVLRSFKKNKVLTCSVDINGNKSNIQVHQAESVGTQSLLLVKTGILSDVLDTTGIVTVDEHVAKLADLQTANILLKAAEEKLLLSVAHSIFSDLPMDVNGHRNVTSLAAIEKINKKIAEHPAINRAANPKAYGERVFKYISRNADGLNEQIFTGVI